MAGGDDGHGLAAEPAPVGSLSEFPNTSTPAPAAPAPGTGPAAPTSAQDALAAIIGQLQNELAAQRAENAALRKTIETLTATLAKLAGAGAGIAKD